MVGLEVGSICLENETLGKVGCKMLSMRSTRSSRRSSLVSIDVERIVGPCEFFGLPDTSIDCSPRNRNGFSSISHPTLLSAELDELGDNPRCVEGSIGTIDDSACLLATIQYRSIYGSFNNYIIGVVAS